LARGAKWGEIAGCGRQQVAPLYEWIVR